MTHFSLARKAALVALFVLPTAHAASTIRLGKAAAVKREEAFVETTNTKVMKVAFQMGALQLNAAKKYKEVSVDNLPLTTEVGMPALPFQAVTIDAAAGDVRVRADLGMPSIVKVGKILPAQEQPCRCPEKKKRAAVFTDKLAEYKAPASGFRVDSLGDYRGQGVSRVVLLPHKYNPQTGVLVVYPNARYEISYPAAPAATVRDSVYDYLVVAPRDLLGGLGAWVDWKKSSQGLRFNVVAYEDLGVTDANGFKTWVHSEYERAQFKYALLVGGRDRIPQIIVTTTTDYETPSDLPYFAMGGDEDAIPEVLAGRVVANNVDTLQNILKKWIAYERDDTAAVGWNRAIGIASNEGSGPSDAEYVKAIQDKFTAAFGAQSVYLFENNADSNPTNFNAQLGTGAMWVTYLGHGSGQSWPSFGKTYSVSDTKNIRNASAVKPVWIDVACLNGALESTEGGANLTANVDPSGEPVGVVAYYGGTVVISWHPPAILARGLAYKMADMVRPVLGEALQAGHRYLTENISDADEILSNQRWYHLQGDPSLRVRLK